jgi:uncharacterized protein YbaA (DUF1428 family)
MSSSEGYVDLYLLPVPADKLDEYAGQASTFGAVAREHGALSYREFRVDDPGEGFGTAEGVVQTAAVAGFRSREHRDEVMGKVMADPRVTALEGDTVADMTQMRYGGFETFVEV